MEVRVLSRVQRSFPFIAIAAVLLFFGLAAGTTFAQSYGSSSHSSDPLSCCCCLSALLVFFALPFAGKKKPQPQPQPPVIVPAATPPKPPVQVIYKEKEIIQEIVKVPCEYCGTLVEVTSQKCPSCGAPFKRH